MGNRKRNKKQKTNWADPNHRGRNPPPHSLPPGWSLMQDHSRGMLRQPHPPRDFYSQSRHGSSMGIPLPPILPIAPNSYLLSNSMYPPSNSALNLPRGYGQNQGSGGARRSLGSSNSSRLPPRNLHDPTFSSSSSSSSSLRYVNSQSRSASQGSSGSNSPSLSGNKRKRTKSSSLDLFGKWTCSYCAALSPFSEDCCDKCGLKRAFDSTGSPLAYGTENLSDFLVIQSSDGDRKMWRIYQWVDHLRRLQRDFGYKLVQGVPLHQIRHLPILGRKTMSKIAKAKATREERDDNGFKKPLKKNRKDRRRFYKDFRPDGTPPGAKHPRTRGASSGSTLGPPPPPPLPQASACPICGVLVFLSDRTVHFKLTGHKIAEGRDVYVDIAESELPRFEWTKKQFLFAFQSNIATTQLVFPEDYDQVVDDVYDDMPPLLSTKTSPMDEVD